MRRGGGWTIWSKTKKANQIARVGTLPRINPGTIRNSHDGLIRNPLASFLGPPFPTAVPSLSFVPPHFRPGFFAYPLEDSAVAQVPSPKREDARLLLIPRAGTGPQAFADRSIQDLPRLLHPNDLLVLNDTRVEKARILLERTRTGGRAEITLVGGVAPDVQLLLRTRGTPELGERLGLPAGAEAIIELTARHGGGLWSARVLPQPDTFRTLLHARGRLPLPPYIKRQGTTDPRDALDEERYQTVFSRAAGAAAAPTAGLHLTEGILAGLKARGVATATVTLHVGLGTFKPIEVADIREHRIHQESYELPAATAEALARCKRRGGRVIAVGTTVTRVLETCAQRSGLVRAGKGETSIYLTPGSPFRVVDGLLTNFHAPDSTLMLLVSAFSGRDRVLAAYAHASRAGYRFLSYGDATLML